MNNLVVYDIENKIYTLRNIQTILDRDLAQLYQVENRALKQAVKRNIDKFPKDFMFELSDDEINFMVSQNVIPPKQHPGGSNPYAFTEQGISMLSAILKSDIAIDVSIKIIEPFVSMRKAIVSNTLMFERLERIEKRLSVGVFFDGEGYN